MPDLTVTRFIYFVVPIVDNMANKVNSFFVFLVILSDFTKLFLKFHTNCIPITQLQEPRK